MSYQSYIDSPPVTSRDPKHQTRVDLLLREFMRTYGKKAEFACRAPGRVNLIGEHIDYMGYSVLPMAIEQDVAIVGSSANDVDECEDIVVVSNLDTARFDKGSFDPSDQVDRCQEWVKYVYCGVKGSLGDVPMSRACCAKLPDKKLKKLRLVVDGRIPCGAGLSSSSALVVASALAAYAATGGCGTRTRVASVCCESERLVGTMGGGMDQAASLLSRQGAALLVSFVPKLISVEVPLVRGAAFVVANSLSDSFKSSDECPFNIRVAECRVACSFLQKVLGLGTEKTILTLKGIEKESGLSTQELLDLSEKSLPESVSGMEEAAGFLELGTDEQLASRLFGDRGAGLLRSLSSHREAGKSLALKKRVRHVLSEARRVQEFASVCNKKMDTNGSSPDVDLRTLGDLMNQSHQSCRDDYECSCQELDSLVEELRSAGALGARLTGAGWGGCAVALVREQDVNMVVGKIRERYVTRGMSDQDISDALFATMPSAGGGFIQAFDHMG